MNGVEYDHTLRDLGRIILELAARADTTPHAEGGGARFSAGAGVAACRRALSAFRDVPGVGFPASTGHYLFSSMILFRSARISGMGSRDTCISPLGPRRMT